MVCIVLTCYLPHVITLHFRLRILVIKYTVTNWDQKTFTRYGIYFTVSFFLFGVVLLERTVY
jgi:hypothetical protein